MAGIREHVIFEERLLSRMVNFVATEAGETSRPGLDIFGLPMLTIEIEDLDACELKKMRFEKLREAGDHPRLNTPNGAQKATPKIQKVPVLLQNHQHFDKYFKPRIVALGPIHNDAKKYQLARGVQASNEKLLRQGKWSRCEVLYNVVENNIKQLRQCFEEKVTEKYSNQAIAWMLFVDGCAILQSIHYAVNRPCQDWKMKYDLMAFGTQDLLLLENQLPYQLLVHLMNSSKNKELLKSITKFMDSQILHGTKPSMEKLENYIGKPIHLLDFLRTLLISKSKSSTPGEKKGRDDKIKEEQDSAAAQQGRHIDRSPEIMSPKKNSKILQSYTYRNVEELRSAGIHVKPGKTDDPLTTITFTKLFHFYLGYLGLSPIIVDDSMGPKFLNLIAYEMCPDFYNKLEITSYILFLDSLIDNIKDVRKLRNAGILMNLLRLRPVQNHTRRSLNGLANCLRPLEPLL